MTIHKVGLAAAFVAASAMIAIGAAGVGAKTRSAGQQTSGIDHLSITYAAGGYEYAAGDNWDKLLGTGAARFRLKLMPGSTPNLVSKHVVFYTPKGSLFGTGSAEVTISGSTETFTNGKADLRFGTGELTGHSMFVRFSGSGSSAKNEYVFHYTGIYK